MIINETKNCIKYISLLFLILILIPVSTSLIPAEFFNFKTENNSIICLNVLILGIATVMTIFKMAETAFKEEKFENALEYMLTLPLSKWRILRIKALTRITMILPFWITYTVLSDTLFPAQTENTYLFFITHPLYMQFTFLFMLGTGFMLSVHDQKNWAAVITLLLFYDLIFMSWALYRLISPYSKTFHSDAAGAAYSITVLTLLIAQVPSFLKAIEKFDLRSFSKTRYLNRYTLPELILILIFSITVLAV